MKRVINVLLVLLLGLCLGACGEKEEETASVGVANPMVEYESLEAINQKVGCKLTTLGVMGVSEEKYFVIADTLAEYDFNLNGVAYTLRAAKETGEDISGVYADGALIFDGIEDDFGFDDENKAFFFIIDGYRYNLVADGELDEDGLYNLYDSLYDLLINEHASDEIKALVGEYQDAFSGRASMNVMLIAYDEVLVDIQWANSAEAFDEWSIVASLSDNKLNYEASNIVHISVVNEEVEYLDDSLAGYFQIEDGKILWLGSGDDYTSNCAFEKID